MLGFLMHHSYLHHLRLHRTLESTMEDDDHEAFVFAIENGAYDIRRDDGE